MRKTFLSRVSTMIREEEDTSFFTVDIGMWAIRDVLEEFPERCMNVGIYEDGMFSIAAGMAKQGIVPTIFGIQPYLIERTLEQIKMDFAYHKVGVNVVGTGAAVDYSKYGYSHYCAEDVMLIKAIPGVQMITPGSAEQFLQLFNQTYRNGSPTFFRISDYPNKKYNPVVNFGEAVVMKIGSKATIIAVSVMLDMVMEACKDLDVTILYYSTVEPFDRKTLRQNCENGRVVICEPEFVGSLDYDIIQALEGKSVQISHVGFPREIFRNYGSYQEKMEYYGLTQKNIHKIVCQYID